MKHPPKAHETGYQQLDKTHGCKHETGYQQLDKTHGCKQCVCRGANEVCSI